MSCPLFIDPQDCLTLLALLFNQENYSLCIISQCLLGLRFPHTVLRRSAVIFCAVNECWTAESWSLKSQCHLVLYMETPHPFPQRTCSSSSFIYSKLQSCHAYRSLKRRLWFLKKLRTIWRTSVVTESTLCLENTFLLLAQSTGLTLSDLSEPSHINVRHFWPMTIHNCLGTQQNNSYNVISLQRCTSVFWVLKVCFRCICYLEILDLQEKKKQDFSSEILLWFSRKLLLRLLWSLALVIFFSPGSY